MKLWKPNPKHRMRGGFATKRRVLGIRIRENTQLPLKVLKNRRGSRILSHTMVAWLHHIKRALFPRYRRAVAVIVSDGNGKVLLCESLRTSMNRPVQTVQGGVEPGETLEYAARRELAEELGLEIGQYELHGPIEKSFAYDWPPSMYQRLPTSAYRGQQLTFFLANVSPNTSFDLDTHHREFERVRWGTPEAFLKELAEPKQPGFTRAFAAFGLTPTVSA